MAKAFLVFLLALSQSLRANFLDFTSSSEMKNSSITLLVEKLKKLEIKDGPKFEEEYSQLVKALENAVDNEKLYCAGEVASSNGSTLPSNKKQFCMRELKNRYIEANKVIYEVKKNYLSFIYKKQLERLSEIQKDAQAEIEKNF